MKSEKLKIAVIICTILVFTASVTGALFFLRDGYRLNYEDEVQRYSNMYGTDIYLIHSIIKAESGGRADAVSDAGAIGLMQIMPSTAEWIAEELDIENFKAEDLKNPETNIRMGTFYLKYLSGKFSGDWIFAAYNAGEGTVRSWQAQGITIENIPYPETARYIEKVNNNIKEYKEKYYLY